MKIPSLIAMAGVALFSAGSHAQNTTWPSARSAHHMVWNATLREVLMFGGVDRSQDSALWSWNGARWNQRATGGPVSRSHAAVAYDVHRNRIIVHGGFESVAGTTNPPRHADTWEFDGRRWSKITDDGPGPRDHHAMVYDPVRRISIMFGGNDPRMNPAVSLSDTWSYDGRAWRRITDNGPPGRSTHRMVFDTKRKRVVTFGGWGTRNQPLGDTWAWDGERWTQLASDGPSPRFAMRMVYDEHRDRIVLFGGRNASGDLADTWEFDGERWLQVDVAGPALRNVHDMAYDAKRNQTLLFGGFNSPKRHADLWSFDGTRWTQHPRPDAAAAVRTSPAVGAHAVGFRVIDIRDRARSTAPAVDFEGTANTRDRSVPLQLSVWYPAERGADRMRVGEYRALFGRQETLGAPSPAEVQASASQIRSGMMFVIGTLVPQQTADSIRDLETAAYRNAVPLRDRFPLVLLSGSAGSSFGLGEYLASYGYVVVSVPTVGTASQQVNRVPVAIETHTRNLEVASSIALTLPGVDTSRIALIGVNFDGLAVLVHQMRNMSARAIVSIDGYETKTNSAAGLRQSPYYEASRVRVPYLAFSQDNAPSAALEFSDSLARELHYSDRLAFVIRDMEHIHLLGNLLVYPQLRAEQRLGYEFLWRTTRMFLDAHVRGDTAARTYLTRTAVQNGYPDWLVKTEFRRSALTPIPTSEEVEAIVMRGEVGKLRQVFLDASRQNPSVRLFTPAELNLFAFRFMSRGDRERAIDLLKLAVEAFPRSGAAHNNLGNGYRDIGNIELALQSWQRFLEVAPSDPALGDDASRAQSIRNIEAKITQYRR